MSSQELQIVLMLTVEFSNIYYKLYQLCHLNSKYRYYKQYVHEYLFLINNFVVVHSNSSISETVRNRTDVHVNIFT